MAYNRPALSAAAAFVTGAAGVITAHVTLVGFPGAGNRYRIVGFGARLAYNTPAANITRISVYRDNPVTAPNELWGTILAVPGRGSDHVWFLEPGIPHVSSNQRIAFESQGAVGATAFVAWVYYFVDAS